MNGKKCICIVLDSVGIGALPDASRFGDEGSHTLLHVMQAGYPPVNVKYADRQRYYAAFDAYFQHRQTTPMLAILREQLEETLRRLNDML